MITTTNYTRTDDKEAVTYSHKEVPPPMIDTLWFAGVGTLVSLLVAVGVYNYCQLKNEMAAQDARIHLLELETRNQKTMLEGIYAEQFPTNRTP